MLEKSEVIVFPKKGDQLVDGMPIFTIMQRNLKDCEKETTEKNKELNYSRTKKTVRNEAVDMGVPPPQKGREDQAREG